MNDNFDRAFGYTLMNEGGFSNHAADSGGATKYGITLATLERWRKVKCNETEVQTLSRNEARAIYHKWYWQPLKLDDVKELVVATVLFDAAVLFGVRIAATRAQKLLNAAGNNLVVDGVFGPKTLTALNSMPQTLFVVGFRNELRARVAEVVRTYPKNSVFLNGWNNRIDRFLTLIA